MLKKLTFNIAELNKNDIGVTYTYHSEPSDNGTVLAHIQAIADHKHNFWLSSNYDEDFIIDEFIEIEDGIYCSGLNFHNTIDMVSKQNCRNDIAQIKTDGTVVTYADQRAPDHEWDFENTIQEYGVADNIEQVKEHFKDLINSDLEFCISVCLITKSSQTERSWRWHKWGKYIGTQNPQCEYLFDEPVIEEVILFNVHVLEDK